MSTITNASSDLPEGVSGDYEKIAALGATTGGLLWRGQRLFDGAPVLIKEGYQRSQCTGADSLQHEYDVFRLLNARGVAKPLDVLPQERPPLLILSGFDGQPLETFLQHTPSQPLRRCLLMMLRLAEAIAGMHGKGIVHSDLRPTNILVASATMDVCIVDISRSISSFASARRTTASADFAYISPEQTGYMNRGVDERSDLYVLGMISYRMLTGRVPFNAHDRLQWVHSHVARSAVPPDALDPNILTIVSKIVLKLLSKDPDQRYQTARGLEHDLARCLSHLGGKEQGLSFALGRKDIPQDFRLSERVYGRTRELNELLGAFHHVAATGEPKLALVYGPPGIGKSCLVQELKRPITAAGGIFLSGKFDPFTQEIPHATITQAFRRLAGRILASSTEEIGCWRRRLQEALGADGGLLTAIVPRLDAVIGEQPEVHPLPPENATSRLHRVFRRFIRAVARPETPLALFLDDIQWADASSLSLVTHLLTHPDTKHVMVIAAYRDREVDSSHPLTRAVEAIRSVVPPLEIRVPLLDGGSLSSLLADSLHVERPAVDSLSELIAKKTNGNPFFVKQFLKTLHRDGLISFDADRARWAWDAERIRLARVTDNVVELMVYQIEQFERTTQDVLKLGACVGNQFDVETLARIKGKPSTTIAQSLAPAVDQGLVLLEEDRTEEANVAGTEMTPTYVWLHDRVRQAVYSMIAQHDVAQHHLEIARTLLQRDDTESEVAFTVARHFNLGAPLITDSSERLQVAKLNLVVGRKAMAATAYPTAKYYLQAGLDLLDDNAWHEHYELMYQLYLNLADTELCTGDPRRAEQRASLAYDQAKTKLEKADAARVLELAQMSMGEYAKMVTTGLEFLRLLGIRLPPHPTRADVLSERKLVDQLVGGRSAKELRNLPPLSHPEMELAVRSPPFSLQADPGLLSMQVARMVRISLEYGVSEASLTWFGLYAFVLAGEFEDYAQALRFARLGADLAERKDLAVARGRYTREESHGTQFLVGMMIFWVDSMSSMIDLIQKTKESAANRGDEKVVDFCSHYVAASLLAKGDRLETVLSEMDAILLSLHQRDSRDRLVAGRQFVKALLGRTAGLASFGDPGFDEAEFEAMLAERAPELRSWYWVYKLWAHFLAGELAEAQRAVQEVRPFLWTIAGRPAYVDFHFYHALCRVAAYEHARPGERSALMAKLERSLKRFAVWANLNSKLFGYFHALVSAEVSRISGRDRDAARLYEESIQAARAAGFTHHQALSFELAARFYAAQGYQAFADRYLREAHFAYRHWGAEAKVAWLEQRHPELKEQRWPPANQTATAGPGLDPLAITKATQAVSEQADLNRLLNTLLGIAMESAGAERAFLVLLREGRLVLAAHAEVEEHGIHLQFERARPLTPGSVPTSIFNYVRHSRERVLLDDAREPNPYSSDEYLKRHIPRSLLCLPILRQEKFAGLLYLENNLVPGAFTADRMITVEALAAQAAMSLEHARLIDQLSASAPQAPPERRAPAPRGPNQ